MMIFNNNMTECKNVWYLCAHSRPLSPSSSSSLIVEGMEGSNSFRSTTPSPSPCSTPTRMPLPSPWRWNCTRRIATPLKRRLCTFVVCVWEYKLLKVQKERRGSLICCGQKKVTGETQAEKVEIKETTNEISFFDVFFFSTSSVKSFIWDQNILWHPHTNQYLHLLSLFNHHF